MRRRCFLHSEKSQQFSDDSDFESDSSNGDSDYVDDDDDDVGSGLCNTMLITGPHGVGKTSLVYALSQQLGYKVSAGFYRLFKVMHRL